MKLLLVFSLFLNFAPSLAKAVETRCPEGDSFCYEAAVCPKKTNDIFHCVENPELKPAKKTAAPKPAPKKPKPVVVKKTEEPKKVETKTYTEKTVGTGQQKDQKVSFKDDNVKAENMAYNPMISAQYTEGTHFACLDHILIPVNRGEGIEGQKKGLRKALKCMDSCIPEGDLDFLVGCNDWEALKTLAPGELGEGIKKGCTRDEIIKGVAEGKFTDTRKNPQTGQCEAGIKREEHLYGYITDLVVQVDNSGSMYPGGMNAVMASLPEIAKTAQDMNLTANIVITSQNIGTGAVVLDARDPELAQKAQQALANIYASSGDAHERELEALRANLKGAIRENANLTVLALTDEVDSSPDKIKNYLADYQKLTSGKVTINSTEPSEGPLTAAAKASGGMTFPLSVNGVAANIREIIEKGHDKPRLVVDRTGVKESYLVTFDGRALEPSEYIIDSKTGEMAFSFPVDLTTVHEVNVVFLPKNEAKSAAATVPGKTEAPAENEFVKACKKLKTPWNQQQKLACSWTINPSKVPAADREDHIRYLRMWLHDRAQKLDQVPLAEAEAAQLVRAYRDGMIERSTVSSITLGRKSTDALLAASAREKLTPETLSFLEAIDGKALVSLLDHLSPEQLKKIEAELKGKKGDHQLVLEMLKALQEPPRTSRLDCDAHVTKMHDTLNKINRTWTERFAYPKLIEAAGEKIKGRLLIEAMGCATVQLAPAPERRNCVK